MTVSIGGVKYDQTYIPWTQSHGQLLCLQAASRVHHHRAIPTHQRHQQHRQHHWCHHHHHICHPHPHPHLPRCPHLPNQANHHRGHHPWAGPCPLRWIC